MAQHGSTPKWGDELSLEVNDDPQHRGNDEVKIDIVKSEILGKSLLGTAVLTVSSLKDGKPLDMWAEIVPKKKGITKGGIHIRMQLTTEGGPSLNVPPLDYIAHKPKSETLREVEVENSWTLVGHGDAEVNLYEEDQYLHHAAHDDGANVINKRVRKDSANNGNSLEISKRELKDRKIEVVDLTAENSDHILRSSRSNVSAPNSFHSSNSGHIDRESIVQGKMEMEEADPINYIENNWNANFNNNNEWGKSEVTTNNCSKTSNTESNVNIVTNQVSYMYLEEDIPSELLRELNFKTEEEKEHERLLFEFLAAESVCGICNLQVDPSSIIDLDCAHKYCGNCLRNAILNHMHVSKSEAVCVCKKPFPQWAVRRVLSNAEFDEYDNQVLQSVIENSNQMFRCPNTECHMVIEKIEKPSGSSSTATNEVGLNGKKLTLAAIAHKDEYRFRCPSCSTEFCSGCRNMPYHLGYTCAEYSVYLNSRHCRFCSVQLTSQNTSKSKPVCTALRDVCNNAECCTKKSHSCTKVLPCGHNCVGIADESTCMPCLLDGCRAENANQQADDYCNICWVEDLNSAPCIQLSCKHIFHYACVSRKIKEKWPSARITFGFLKCPLCQSEISHPALANDLKFALAMKEDIQNKAVQRLKFEQMEKVDDIVKPNGKYYKNPLGYAMDRFAYYPCFKCKKPYFGGMRRCDAGNQEGDGSFKAEDLVCGGCSGLKSDQCKKHGKEFIEHKCQYCCSVATWFCWGKTHFCESCHSKQQKGDYVSKYPKEKLPKCPGKGKCPLRIQHPPNGEPFSLGCVLCRNLETDF